MPTIAFDGSDYLCRSGESVLECLTRQGVMLASSCKAGICQTCLMHCHSGHLPKEAQKGLKDTYQSQGYFLACICHPDDDMAVGLSPNTHHWHKNHVLEKTPLANGIVRLRLESPPDFTYEAGQFINLKGPEDAVRSYSMASLSTEPYIELHIKRIEGGKVSQWLADDITVSDTIEINGPIGNCFYIPEKNNLNAEKNLLLAGTGTGLAPLYGIIQSALQKNHQEKIHLFHGSVCRETLYLFDELLELSQQHAQFFYTPCILEGNTKGNEIKGDLAEIIKTTYPSLNGWKAYLCGDPSIVKKLRMHCFISGVSMEDIYADPFESAST